METIVEINNLSVKFTTRERTMLALDSISMTVAPGEVVGVLGESGCGKSVLAQAILGLIQSPGQIDGGEIRFDGHNLASLTDEKVWHQIRGKQIGLIVPNARAYLNPLISVGRQIANVVREAEPRLETEQLLSRAIDALKRVGISDPSRRITALPHEFSGGMCQRVVITMAMVNSPRLLVADEPTSGLDVTVQRQVLDLMRALVSDSAAGVLMMTRDPGVVAHYCNRVIVMRQGHIVEEGDVRDFFRRPKKQHSRELLVKAAAAQAGSARLLATAE